jgi:ATP-binding protein involved in chromosome partitioning
MDAPDRAVVLAALDQVKDPKSGQGLSTAGLVRGLAVGGGRGGVIVGGRPRAI